MYFVKRILFAIPLLLVISALAFALVHLAPGGPFDRERAPASPEIERALRAKYHLDEPVWKQYCRYLGDLAHGDFGVSLKYRNHTVSHGLTLLVFLGSDLSEKRTETLNPSGGAVPCFREHGRGRERDCGHGCGRGDGGYAHGHDHALGRDRDRAHGDAGAEPAADRVGLR